VLEVAAPGLLVVKHHRGEGGKFVNVAVIEGDQVKVIDEQASSLPDCPPLLTSLLGFETAGSWAGSVNVLVQLAVSMRAHGRGGALLVVPADHDSWRESIIQPTPYSVAPPFSELAELAEQAETERAKRRWRDALAEAVSAVAGLTAVDGATIRPRYDVVVFGAKTPAEGLPIEKVAVTEPIEGGTKAVSSNRLRHKASAAQFVHDPMMPSSASQDASPSSPCEELVCGLRLLLW
jgi:ribosomal protein S16